MSNGTDNHLILWDLRPQGLTGSKMEKVLEEVSISVNKNTVAGDKSSLSPSGIRIGTPALTTRGFTEEDMVKVGEFYDRATQIAVKIQAESGKQLKAFVEGMHKCEELKVWARLRVCTPSCHLSMPPSFCLLCETCEDSLGDCNPGEFNEHTGALPPS